MQGMNKKHIFDFGFHSRNGEEYLIEIYLEAKLELNISTG